MVIFLNEFSRNLSDVKQKLYAKTDILVEHLTYLTLDPNNINRDHWISEVYSFMHSVDTVKPKNKLPNKKFIYSNLYGDSEDTYMNKKFMFKFLQDIQEKENIMIDAPLEDVIKDIHDVCVKYFSWLSEELASSGRVLRLEVVNKINEIIPKES